jgi:type II secretory pathway component PulM
MNETGGWTIWGKSRERIRRFSVALPSGVDAVAALKADNPDIEALTKHAMSVSPLDHLGMMQGDPRNGFPSTASKRL